jgi:antitoxin component YwqK of YwqJK toxin-antitoxin module
MPTITIICGNKRFQAVYGRDLDSGLIDDAIRAHGEDVEIPIEDKYCSVIGNYVAFLGGEEIPVIDEGDMIQCLNIAKLFMDDSYMGYLAEQVFNNWTIMSNIVYNNLNDELRQDVLLRGPYVFLPDYLVNDKMFMTEYEKDPILAAKVNDNEVYYSFVEGKDRDFNLTISTYHTVNGEEVGKKLVKAYYYPSINILYEGEYINGLKHGRWKYYYDNKQHTLEHEANYIDEVKHGLWRQWYDNEEHTLKAEGEYKNGQRVGHWIYYDVNGNVITSNNYY